MPTTNATKLLDMLPENLREGFIEEVKEILEERTKKGSISDKEADADIKAWSDSRKAEGKKA